MLKFNHKLFEIVDNEENFEKFKTTDETMIHYLKEYDYERTDWLKKYHETNIHRYALVAKEDVEIAVGDEKYLLKKGDAVLRGNHTLFYGAEHNLFENSYFGDGIIINLSDKGATFNVTNSIFRNESKDKIGVWVREKLDSEYSNIGLKLDQLYQNAITNETPVDFFIINSSEIKNSQATLDQDEKFLEDISSLDWLSGNRIHLDNITPNNKNLKNNSIKLDDRINVRLSDIKMDPNTVLYFKNFFNEMGDDEDLSQEHRLSKIELINPRQDKISEIVFSGGYSDVNSIRIENSFDSFSFISDEMSIKGKENSVLKTAYEVDDISPDAPLIGSIGATNIKIDLKDDSQLTFLDGLSYCGSEVLNLEITSGKSTKTEINPRFFGIPNTIKIKNTKKRDMVIDTELDFLNFDDENLSFVVEDSTVKGGVMISGDGHYIFIKDSMIENSALRLINNKEQKARITAINAQAVISGNMFEDDSELILKEEKFDKIRTVFIANNLFAAHSKTTITADEVKRMSVEKNLLKGDVNLCTIEELGNNKITDTSLKDIRRVHNSTLKECVFKNIESINEQFLENKEMSFNIRGELKIEPEAPAQITKKVDHTKTKLDVEDIDF